MGQCDFDCIIVGAGHAGIEAALAASRMGCETLLLTLSLDTVGLMSCNPAIGGVGKGQLVKEIDALGGEMGLAADRTGIQFRQLNASKGQSVRSSRCQSDRRQYRLYMQEVVRRQPRLTVAADQVTELVVRGSEITGVRTMAGQELRARSVVITAGTFLRGRMHLGPKIVEGGRVGEPASVRLTDNLKDLGLEIWYFKTGTPPRLDGKTIDFSRMEIQHSDPRPVPFSFRTARIPASQTLLPCHITYTTAQTHEIIRQNMHLSPMYSGQIQATGVRYCPSIEDKIKRFADKSRHHVFLEPEGLDTDEYYPNGISTGLPVEVQEEMVHSIPGLEQARVIRPGYSIEHGVIPPTSLLPHLETRTIRGLFLAGQINGTTGYEEAAAQGIMAGINAALRVQNREPFLLGRHESYIGVLIDDLVTKGTNEPYRMFTSRVEYRLVVREDNADQRLAHHGHRLGLLTAQDLDKVNRKYALIEQEIAHLRATKIYPGSDQAARLDVLLEEKGTSPIRQPVALSDLLKRPQVCYQMIAEFDGLLKDQPPEMIEQVEYAIKYEGFIQRQTREIARFRHLENIRIPPAMDYTGIPGLSREIQQKLERLTPQTLGQALRISGVTPSAISILMVHLRKVSKARGAEVEVSTGDDTDPAKR